MYLGYIILRNDSWLHDGSMVDLWWIYGGSMVVPLWFHCGFVMFLLWVMLHCGLSGVINDYNKSLF